MSKQRALVSDAAEREKRSFQGKEIERSRIKSNRRGVARVRALGRAPERGSPALRALSARALRPPWRESEALLRPWAGEGGREGGRNQGLPSRPGGDGTRRPNKRRRLASGVP